MKKLITQQIAKITVLGLVVISMLVGCNENKGTIALNYT